MLPLPSALAMLIPRDVASFILKVVEVAAFTTPADMPPSVLTATAKLVLAYNSAAQEGPRFTAPLDCVSYATRGHRTTLTTFIFQPAA